MMTWILENIVKQIESGTESWRAESRGGKSLANEHGELYDKKHLKSDVLQEVEQLQHIHCSIFFHVILFLSCDIRQTSTSSKSVPARTRSSDY